MALGAIVLTFLLANTLFGVVFYFSDGIAHMRPGSFQDAFFFSVQTMATIGYGDMHPTARVVFSRHAVISPIDGVPHLQFRLGNERGNQILEAQLRVTLVRKERTLEGIVLYRMYELPLVRDRSSAFTRSWLAMHKIDDKSLLFGATPESIERDEVELITSLVGTDDTSLQPMHARHTYESEKLVFGARHVDILSESEDGTFVVDLHKFHDVTPTEPTATFPYPKRAREESAGSGEFEPG
jgi:inward rectifier potassium channel